MEGWLSVVAVVIGFVLGYAVCSTVHAMRRPKLVTNPYLGHQQARAHGAAWDASDDASMTEDPVARGWPKHMQRPGEHHHFTRPPGWHP